MKLLIRLTIITISIVLAAMLYQHHFDIQSVDDTVELEKQISKMIGEETTLVTITPLDVHYAVSFTFILRDEQHQGFALLEKGLNKRYKLIKAYYEKDRNHLSFEDIVFQGEDRLVVYGNVKDGKKVELFTDDASIEFYPGSEDILIFAKIDIKSIALEKYFVTHTDGTKKVVDISYDIKMLSDYRGFIDNGSGIIVLSAGGLIIIFGFMFSFMFTPKNNLLERLFNRVTHANVQSDYESE